MKGAIENNSNDGMGIASEALTKEDTNLLTVVEYFPFIIGVDSVLLVYINSSLNTQIMDMN